MGWLYLFLARLVTGERWRKARPAEKGFAAAFLLFIPVAFTLVLLLERLHSRIFRLFDSGALTLWMLFTAGASAATFGCIAWSRYVPIRISIVLAVLAWLVLLFLLFGLGYWDFGKT